jgi:hypothetical protein
MYVHAFVTGPNGVGMKDLGAGFSQGTEGIGINNVGQAIGYSFSSGMGGGGGHTSFITGPNGEGMRQLQRDPEWGGSLEWVGNQPIDINDAGQVVGFINNADYFYGDMDAVARHAFVTGPNGEGIMDLNSYADLPDGAYLNVAYGINNLGQVIATLAYRDATPPIPEPETYALMLAGLGLLGFMARRKKMENS